MTKAELVSHVSKRSNITKNAASAALTSLVEAIQQTLKKGGEVRISSLGTFRVVQRKARAGVNPRTGAKIRIPATRAARFRAAKALRDAVTGTAAKAAQKK
jgi:DNA-binding protein HU-beta